jgi:hypothetical protein
MARSGMSALIEELRGLTEAGYAEYTLGTTVYWSDNALQDMLDLHRMDLKFWPMQSYPQQGAGGTLQYFEHRTGYGYFEQTSGGTEIFYLQDSTGAVWSPLEPQPQAR